MITVSEVKVQDSVSLMLTPFEKPGQLREEYNERQRLQKQTCGFRDMEFFKLKIYALHETK